MHVDGQLKRFEEALHDSSSGLTYTALSGVCKQSVEDVERLFGDSLIKCMEKSYTVEAEYIHVVCNWRRACDERGLSSAQRSQFNSKFLNYVLDEMMPWHMEDGVKDFSLLEVNRYILYLLLPHVEIY